MGTSKRHSEDVRARAVRMVQKRQAEHDSQWGTILSISSKIGCTPQSLHRWVARAKRDQGKRPRLSTVERDWLKELELEPKIQRVWQENLCEYVARRTWKQLNRQQIRVRKCTVVRLMCRLGLHGAVRGKGFKITVPDASDQRPADLVDRRFVADRPNQLWVADFTYVATWQGFVLVAFVVDACSRMIAG